LKKLPLKKEPNFLYLKSKLGKESPKDEKDEKKQTDIEENLEMQKKRENFSKWILDGERFLYGEELRNGITKLLNSKYEFLDYISTTLENSGIKYKYSVKIPLHLIDIDQKRQEDVIRLEIERQTKHNLLDFSFEHGISSFSDEIGLEKGRFLESSYLLIDWIDNNYLIYNDKIKANIEADGLKSLNLELFAIFAKCFIQNIFFGRNMLDWENLTEDLSKKVFPEIYKNCKFCTRFLNDIICVKCKKISNPLISVGKLSDLKKNIYAYEGFFQIIFNLGKGIRNYNLLSSKFKVYKKDFKKIENQILKFEYGKINSRIVIKLPNKSEIQLKEIVRFIQDIYRSLKRKIDRKFINTNLSNLLESFKTIISYQDEFSEIEFKKKITNLKEAFYSKDWNPKWYEDFKMKNIDFTEFFKNLESSLKLYNELIKQNQISIFDFNTFISQIITNINDSKEYKILRVIDDEIFKKVNHHQVLINNSDFKDFIILKTQKLESYKEVLKEIKENFKEL